VIVEVAAFDIQKIKDPSIESKDYQQGEQSGFSNVREYVLNRDGHRCQCCKGKSKDPILNVHHIVSRKTGGNRPANLITLCKTCHDGLHLKKVDFKPKVTNGFKAESFMTAVRWKIVNGINNLVNTEITYGYLTKDARFKLGLGKSHVNDAFVIAGGNGQKRLEINYLVKQVRKQNRKLYKGARSSIRNTASRFVNGFQRFDKVILEKTEGFIMDRRSTGYFDVRTLAGLVLSKSIKSSKLKLLENFRTIIWEKIPIPPTTKVVGFLGKS
jgi:N6-L-threonylcarbamoyladenine synthase